MNKMTEYKYFSRTLKYIFKTNNDIEWDYDRLSYCFYLTPYIYLSSIDKAWCFKALKYNPLFVAKLFKVYMCANGDNDDPFRIVYIPIMNDNIWNKKNRYVLGLEDSCSCTANKACDICVSTRLLTMTTKYNIRNEVRNNMINCAYLNVPHYSFLDKFIDVIKNDEYDNTFNWLYYDGPSKKTYRIKAGIRLIIYVLKNKVSKDSLNRIIEYLLPVMFY